ncbi:MAG: phosphopantothenate--cysteine ligase [Oscillospiraceae bacterium]|jgi:phosphopantothenate-cysteine ligase|nr:phosphopantothenate--cysteine ligase [Oscillospiraceae bacterium]
MNILITAGGTTEQIDAVRGITNFSTGRLGCLIAESFVKRPEVERIYYLAGKNAQFLPKSDKVRITAITGVASLEAAAKAVVTENDIAAVVHSMAVSDYRVRSVISTDTGEQIDRTRKIESGRSDIRLELEPTPKIISIFKEITPKSLLVGFKLMDSVPRETLIATAYGILRTERCRFVLANDQSEILGDRHVGYLVDAERQVTRFESKQAIADGICAAVIQNLNKE